jgi:hypothetical protein
MNTSDTYNFWLGSFFHSEKLPAYFLLAGMVVTFLCVRGSSRLIRRGVRWWPTNIHRGKVHVHHVVIGLPAMFIFGVVEFAARPGAPWVEILALCFGGAAGATFDEFALIFHLKDVYWEHEGRQSVAAVVLGMSFIVFMAIGMIPLGYSDPLSQTALLEWGAVGAMVLDLVFVSVAFLKGKLWMGWVGLFIPIVGFAAAVRLARPRSIWALWRYDSKPQKIARAERRAADYERRWGCRQKRFVDFVAGAPNARAPKDTAEQAPLPESLPLVPGNVVVLSVERESDRL